MGKILVITGPTATGKTALGIDLAKKYNGELISADSRQVYKGLDIGTGKLSIEQLNDLTIRRFKGLWIVNGIKIHGFDLIQPGKQFTVADFLKFASESLIRISRTGKLPIIVGGTGFYIKALIDGIDSLGVPPNQVLRAKLEKLSVGQLYQELLKINPKRAKSMNESDRTNPRRLIRAIEIALHKTSTSEESEPLLAAKRATSEVNENEESEPFDITQDKPTDSAELTAEASEVKTSYQLPHQRPTSQRGERGSPKAAATSYLLLGLTAPNSYLYERADKWLSRRLTKGMFDEVQNLINQNVNPRWLDSLGLEYRWLSRYLLGKITKQNAIDRLEGNIHSFIRRQKTWFKKFKDTRQPARQVQLFDISKANWRIKLEKTVKDWYISHSLQASLEGASCFPERKYQAKS